MEFNSIEFSISETFLSKYKRKVVSFGPLGYLTHKRTYARPLENGKTEDWWQTVKRVVEGCYLIQKRHCKFLCIPWNERQAKRSAEVMYDLIFNFKFIPPGRGLWAMGTDFILNKTSAPLFNCAFITTNEIKEDFSAPFTWAMDMSMLGVGVGFDVLGANTNLFLKAPRIVATPHIVEDSREGWTECFRRILDAFVHKDTLPSQWDYSQIRPAGSPLKTFGGQAPGFQPLEKLIKRIITLLDNYVKEDKSVDATLIVDLMNFSGEAVVSGGIRRTAQLVLGPLDEEYINLKSSENLSNSNLSRWASNNSISATIGMDYSIAKTHSAINGEPGYVWLDNCRNYGRLVDGKGNYDPEVVGTNPCLTGDTLVAVADGRGSVSIAELANKGEDVPVYCHDFEGNLKIKWGRNPRLTGEKVPIVKVNIEGGHSITCTPNHKFLVRKKGIISEVEAKNLKSGSSLVMLTKYMPDGRSSSRADNYISNSFSASISYEHVSIYEFYNKIIDKKGHIHHLDRNKLNNNPDNLFLEDASIHLSEHSTGDQNPNFSHITNEEMINFGVELCKKLERRFSTKEWVRFAKRNNLPMGFSSYRQQSLGCYSTFSKNCAIKANTTLNLPKQSKILVYLQKAIEQNYKAFIINNKVVVEKYCENCNNIFLSSFIYRERAYCSMSCASTRTNKKRDYSLNKIGQDKRSSILASKNAKDQIKVLKDLFISLDRKPFKTEWIKACKEKNIPTRLHKNSLYKTFKQLCNSITENHKVISVELAGYSDVYNITVDDYHNLFIGGFAEKTAKNRDCLRYFGVMQCGEIPLESSELCNICDVVPSRHNSLEEFLTTLKYAYLYSKTVTLIPTHSTRTNAVQFKNRRIGVGLTGIIENINKIGYRNHIEWCDKGYKVLKNWDHIYSNWMCVPRSIKLTTVKPAGTTSLLPGVTPGIHFPHSEYYIRRIRINKNSDMWKTLKDAGYKVEKDEYETANTMVVELPIHEPNFSLRKDQVSIWEQFELAAAMQVWWSDNSVSCTITVPKGQEGELPRALAMYEERLKSISFLPLKADNVYAQAPYESITKEQYEKIKLGLKKYHLDVQTEDRVEEKFCNNDTCGI